MQLWKFSLHCHKAAGQVFLKIQHVWHKTMFEEVWRGFLYFSYFHPSTRYPRFLKKTGFVRYRLFAFRAPCPPERRSEEVMRMMTDTGRKLYLWGRSMLQMFVYVPWPAMTGVLELDFSRGGSVWWNRRMAILMTYLQHVTILFVIFQSGLSEVS